MALSSMARHRAAFSGEGSSRRESYVARISAGRSHEPTLYQKGGEGRLTWSTRPGGLILLEDMVGDVAGGRDGTGKRTRCGEGLMRGRRALTCGVGQPRLSEIRGSP
jgi:hypothetical protein